MAAVDDLFELKNLFYTGSYQAAIQEATTLGSLQNAAMEVNRKVFLYRSYIEQGNYKFVLNDISGSESQPSLQAVRLLALYKSDPERTKESVIESFENLLGETVAKLSPVVHICAGIVYSFEGQTDSCFRCFHEANNIEGHSLIIQFLLSMNRPDLATKHLHVMINEDEDSTLTQMATASISLYTGDRKKAKDSRYVYQELCDKYQESPLLLNSLFVCNYISGDLEEAERCVQQALDKNPNDEDALFNMLTLSNQIKKSSDIINRYNAQIKTVSPNHIGLKKYQDASEAFDRCAKAFSAKVSN